MSYSTPFRTRSEIVPCKQLAVENVALSALDIGYSAVKGFSSTTRFCIPSYVRECSSELLGQPHDTDIRYRGENGIEYAVGRLAQEALSSKDTNDASNTMFGRNRYFSPSFLILARVGLALSISPGEKRPIYLQTGLPPAYRKADTALLKEALAGKHTFSVKVGAGPWTDYSFELGLESIFVMDQPIGSVYSASKRSDGTTVLCPDGKPYIDHRILVLDGGFGTLDIFSVTNRTIDSTNTFNDLGMKVVFEGTAADIFAQTGKEVYAHTLQNCLVDGFITVYDRHAKSTRRVDISDILKANTRRVCEKAMDKIEAAYDGLQDYDFLLVTGGTGAAWMDILKERYQRMETLSIISATGPEKMSSVYSNARGYYIYRALASGKA